MTERFKGVFNARLVVAASSNEAIQNADIITSVTTARVATFDGTLVKPGMSYQWGWILYARDG
mgnify:CR=1 FL=1